MGANTGEQTVAANGNGWAENQPTVALVLQHRLGWWQIFNAQARGTSCWMPKITMEPGLAKHVSTHSKARSGVPSRTTAWLR